jgi:ATP phosphoribosyltransferase regulatory subunit
MQATIGSAERVTFALRSLYDQYGYTQYKMSKFEEYDLYARNKDFLVSDSVITFTDLGGKLMALKPDVTLSIVKNSKDTPNSVQKLYYHENVYRVTKGAHGFKEIMQVGLECLGDVDDYCIAEVLMLAAKSLKVISEDAVLDVSHLGILKELTDSIGIPNDSREKLVKFISEKNIHELTVLCEQCGVQQAHIDILRWLMRVKGVPSMVLPQLKETLAGLVSTETLSQFETILSALDDPMLRIDFSVVDDIHYYNGIVFKGFVRGLTGSVLSGGQYDKLMRKMKRTDRAVGFAVYTDLLDRLEQPGNEYDVDIVLLYDGTSSLGTIRQQAQDLIAQGNSVMVLRSIPETIRYKQLMKLTGNEVQVLENNA